MAQIYHFPPLFSRLGQRIYYRLSTRATCDPFAESDSSRRISSGEIVNSRDYVNRYRKHRVAAHPYVIHPGLSQICSGDAFHRGH